MSIFTLEIFILVQNLKRSKNKSSEYVSLAINMSFQELLAMREKKLGGKYLTPGPEGLVKEDRHGGGEGHHHFHQYHEHHH